MIDWKFWNQARPEVLPFRRSQDQAAPVREWLQGPAWLGFLFISCWTNFHGLQPLMGAVVAGVLSVAIAAAVAYLGYVYLRCRGAGRRKRVLAVWGLVALASILFSYMGFESLFDQDARRRNAPVLRRDALRRDADSLAQSIVTARNTALHFLANESDYLRERVARAQAQLDGDAYTDPNDGRVSLAEWQVRLETLQQQRAAWEAFHPDLVGAVAAKTEDEGYRQLREAHDRLTELWGTVRFREKQADYQLPPAPTPPVLEAEAARKGEDNPMLGPLLRLLRPGPVQLFALLLALVLDLCPLGFAWSGIETDGGEAGSSGATTGRVDPGATAGETYREFTERVWQRYQATEAFGSRTAVDAAIAHSVAELGEARTAALDNIPLQELGAALVERLHDIADLAERLGIPPEQVLPRVEAAFRGYEVRAELRERREAAQAFQSWLAFAADVAATVRRRAPELAPLGQDYVDTAHRRARELAGMPQAGFHPGAHPEWPHWDLGPEPEAAASGREGS